MEPPRQISILREKSPLLQESIRPRPSRPFLCPRAKTMSTAFSDVCGFQPPLDQTACSFQEGRIAAVALKVCSTPKGLERMVAGGGCVPI